MTYYIVITHAPDPDPEVADYYAEIPELPGCHSSGYTENDAYYNVLDALEDYLGHSREYNLPIPEPRNKCEIICRVFYS